MRPTSKSYHVLLRGDRCQCPACLELFNSARAFDYHRRGSFEPLTRRCLTVAEMAAAGMALNPPGFWVTETRAKRARRDIGRARGSGDCHQARTSARLQAIAARALEQTRDAP